MAVVLVQNGMRLSPKSRFMHDEVGNDVSSSYQGRRFGECHFYKIDSVEPIASQRRQGRCFVRRSLDDRVGDARTDNSRNWQANLQKAKDGHCHVMGVAVRSGDTWIKAINTDFEIK